MCEHQFMCRESALKWCTLCHIPTLFQPPEFDLEVGTDCEWDLLSLKPLPPHTSSCIGSPRSGEDFFCTWGQWGDGDHMGTRWCRDKCASTSCRLLSLLLWMIMTKMVTIFVSAIILFCFTGLKETAEDLVKRKKGWLNVLWVFSPFLAVPPQFLREMFVKTTQVICKTVCENCIVGSSYSLGCYNEKVKSFTLLWEWLFLWSMKFLFPMENPWIRECEGHLLHTILIDKVLQFNSVSVHSGWVIVRLSILLCSWAWGWGAVLLGEVPQGKESAQEREEEEEEEGWNCLAFVLHQLYKSTVMYLHSWQWMSDHCKKNNSGMARL